MLRFWFLKPTRTLPRKNCKVKKSQSFATLALDPFELCLTRDSPREYIAPRLEYSSAHETKEKVRMRAMFLFAALALSASGCMHIVAVPSVQGKSFVIKTTPFGGSMWNCDASDANNPTCFKVTEVPLAGK